MVVSMDFRVKGRRRTEEKARLGNEEASILETHT